MYKNLDAWKAANDGKRFRRTKEEIALGLSSEEAFERRKEKPVV